mmetsp:Transcript_60699/g.113435  ORF Transcript_60699/g.113435 Transcript_60699/m.113435 type:complete len:215 (+) Transcript_60699:109-753(+)
MRRRAWTWTYVMLECMATTFFMRRFLPCTFCGMPSLFRSSLHSPRIGVRPQDSTTTVPAIGSGGVVAMAPPPTIPMATSEPSWTECFLKSQGDTGSGQDMEVWLFRSDTSAGFEKFLQHRHFGSEDAATCRSINPDSSIQCLECTRVIFGGVYGSIGVVVPAYPPENQATGCLSRNRVVEADFDDDDNYDGNPTREVALCNTHRGQLDSVPIFD